MPRATTPSAPATTPLNLAALVKPLPPVILPDGSEHPLVYTAHAAEAYKRVRVFVDLLRRGEEIPQLEASDAIDECLTLVLPSATPDHLASFGERTELKLAVIAAAAGRVDAVLQTLYAAQGNAEPGAGVLPTTLGTTSAA